jgi:hypothetical protein
LVGVAVKVTEEPAQTGPAGEAAMLTLTADAVLTVIVIVLELAGEPVRHGVAFEVISTEISSPLLTDAGVKVALFDPAGAPFRYHWYVGAVPPLTGAAVKVTEVPSHTGPAGDAEMVTLAGREALRDAVTANLKVLSQPATVWLA